MQEMADALTKENCDHEVGYASVVNYLSADLF
jgi:hypothetical protein